MFAAHAVESKYVNSFRVLTPTVFRVESHCLFPEASPRGADILIFVKAFRSVGVLDLFVRELKLSSCFCPLYRGHL